MMRRRNTIAVILFALCLTVTAAEDRSHRETDISTNVRPTLDHPFWNGVKTLWHQDFEGQICGQHPPGWKEEEQPGDALVTITNAFPCNGSKAMLLDCKSGADKKASAGLSRAVPRCDQAWGVFSFIVYFGTPGAKQYIELRDRRRNSRLMGIKFGDRFGPNFSIFTGERKHYAKLGKYETKRWYRLTLWLPNRQNSENSYCTLENWVQGKWEVLTNARMPSFPRNTQLGYIRVGMPPQDTLTVIDDWRYASTAELPEIHREREK